MNARWALVLGLVAAATAPAGAQAPAWQFRWQTGQTLTYKVSQVTAVAEAADGGKAESASRLDLVKRWQVVDVDSAGVATLHMAVTAMRNEQTRPDKEVLLFDSDNPDKSTPELREQMGKFIGKTLAVLRVDALGRVVEVKQGSAARYEAEPPFSLVLPDAAAHEGQAWARPFTLVLDPPQGTGEKHEAAHKYTCIKLADGTATVAVKTAFKALPESVQDRLPLVQKEAEGTVVFDLAAGRVLSASFTVDQTVENHQGPGSSYRFRSRHTEELLQPQGSAAAVSP